MYSQDLRRNIHVPIELTNDVQTAELNAAIRRMPNYPDTSGDDIREAAARGSIDAQYIIQRAQEGEQEAKDWLAS